MVQVLGYRQGQQTLEMIELNTTIVEQKPSEDDENIVAYDAGHLLHPECTMTALRSLLSQNIRKVLLPVKRTTDNGLVIDRDFSTLRTTNTGSSANWSSFTIRNNDVVSTVGGTFSAGITKTVYKTYSDQATTNYAIKLQPVLTLDEVFQFANENNVKVILELPDFIDELTTELVFAAITTNVSDKSNIYVILDMNYVSDAWFKRYKNEGIQVIHTFEQSGTPYNYQSNPSLVKTSGVAGVIASKAKWTTYPSAANIINSFNVVTIAQYANRHHEYDSLRALGVEWICSGDPVYTKGGYSCNYITFQGGRFPVGFLFGSFSVLNDQTLYPRGTFTRPVDPELPGTLRLSTTLQATNNSYFDLGALALPPVNAPLDYDIVFKAKCRGASGNNYQTIFAFRFALENDVFDPYYYTSPLQSGYEVTVYRALTEPGSSLIFLDMNRIDNGVVTGLTSNFQGAGAYAAEESLTLRIRVWGPHMQAYLVEYGLLTPMLYQPRYRGRYFGVFLNPIGTGTFQNCPVGFVSVERGSKLF